MYQVAKHCEHMYQLVPVPRALGLRAALGCGDCGGCEDTWAARTEAPRQHYQVEPSTE